MNKNNTLTVGESYQTIVSYTQEQVQQFAQLTGDHNPIHFDEEFAAKTPFKRPIIHGCFSMSVFSKIIGMDFPGEGSIYMTHDITFLRPMYVETNYKVVIEILEIDTKKNTAVLSTDIFTEERNKAVVRGKAKVMHPERFC